jgi:hypothetical protein
LSSQIVHTTLLFQDYTIYPRYAAFCKWLKSLINRISTVFQTFHHCRESVIMPVFAASNRLAPGRAFSALNRGSFRASDRDTLE